MSCCKCNCAYLSIIVAILAGITLGVLYALGFVATAVAFWVYLATGIFVLLLSPIYAASSPCKTGCACFAQYRNLLLASAVGTIFTAVISLIVTPIASIVVAGIVLGIATLFAVLLLGVLVCLTACLCRN